MRTSVNILLFLTILLIGTAGLAAYWTFYRPLPDYSVEVRIEGLQDEVDIYWSDYGVPHIYASNKRDLYRAVGYVHAQDRRWQMMMSQLSGEGRFAEFFGPDLLPLDRLQRTIGFWRIAKKMEAQLDDTTRSLLQAYADGVNHYTRAHPKERSPQFALAGVEPPEWTPTHSLALARLLAWQLNIAWKTELTYTLLQQQLGGESFAELFPDQPLLASQPGQAPPDSSAVIASLLPLLQTYHQLQSVTGSHGRTAGSNAWAVAPEKSASKKPMLAGDPHLGLRIPGTWYEVHLHLDGRNLSGATLPGVPFVVLGQNDRLAWSLTNVMLDDTDFFREKLHPQDASRYLLDSLAGEPIYEAFEEQREVIQVKNQDDVIFTRKRSKHGPVISSLPKADSLFPGTTITMQWTGQNVSHELRALEKMGWASSFEAFEAATADFKVPGQNLIYADSSGTIARLTLADVPVRSGNPLVLRDGWNPFLDWQGSIPHDELPRVVNPARGWVANANNRIIDEEYPYYITNYWQADARYERIREYLAGNDHVSSDAFQVMQLDTYSNYSREVARIIIPMLQEADRPGFPRAIEYLQNWDYKYETTQTAASIMEVFMIHLSRNTFRDEMGDALYRQYISYTGNPVQALMDALQNGSSYFDNINQPGRQRRTDIITLSMQQSLAYLERAFGDDASEWRWGNLHTVTLRAPFFSAAAEEGEDTGVLNLITSNVLNKGPRPAPGHAMSINNGEYLWNEPFQMILGPSIRRIVDFSNTSRSLSIIPGGQSENPFSDYYNDQTEQWLNGNYKFFYHDSTNMGSYQKMKLLPGN